MNPNGIAITASGTVKVGGGFVASTLGLSDQSFNDGKLNFSGNGNSASISNDGTIKTAPGGFVGLLGGSVSNAGTISAPLGRIGLGAGERQTLDLHGDGFLQVALPSNAPTNKPLVDVSGKVRAAGGRVEIKAATAAQVVRDAVNVSGSVSASSARRVGGSIVFDGGEGGKVGISGKVAANSRAGTGGTIRIGGQSIKLQDARIAASGVTGGGSIKIGGGVRGATVPGMTTAKSVSVDSGTSIKADARKAGNGGEAILWADGTTHFRGAISAQALGDKGNGGMAEVSGGKLDFQGAANLQAKAGSTGTLLLDPTNITIQNASGTPAVTCDAAGNCTASGSNSVLTVANLQSALATSNVIVSTASNGPDVGNITVVDPLTWSANTTLTLDATGAIALNAGITNSGTGSGLTLNAAARGASTEVGLSRIPAR